MNFTFSGLKNQRSGLRTTRVADEWRENSSMERATEEESRFSFKTLRKSLGWPLKPCVCVVELVQSGWRWKLIGIVWRRTVLQFEDKQVNYLPKQNQLTLGGIWHPHHVMFVSSIQSFKLLNLWGTKKMRPLLRRRPMETPLRQPSCCNYHAINWLISVNWCTR